MSTEIDIPDAELKALREVFPKGVIAFDLETTGLSPLTHKIIEIGAVKITPDRIEVFDELINPGVPIPPFTTTIHGITDEMVREKKGISEILPQFTNFQDNLPMIAHKAEFDIGFIVFNLHKENIVFPTSDIYCSCKWGRHLFKESPNFKLGTLTEKLGITLTNHHHAFDDALASLRIFARGILRHAELRALFSLKPGHFANFSGYAKSDEAENIPLTDKIREVIEAKAEIEILYSGGSHKNVFRPVRPMSLLPMPGGNILYAECLLTHEFKSFSLKKIKEVRHIPNK